MSQERVESLVIFFYFVHLSWIIQVYSRIETNFMACKKQEQRDRERRYC